MSIKKAISLLIQQELYSLKGLNFVVAKVKSVNKDNCSCEVETLHGVVLYNVNLRAVIDGVTEGFVVFPSVNSLVLVGKIGNENNAFIAMFSTITDCWIDADIVLNGGDNKGIPKLQPLVEKLNALEQKVNDLIQFSSTHTHTGVTTGSGSTGVAMGVTGNLSLTQEGDLENQNVKQ